jgi:transposase
MHNEMTTYAQDEDMELTAENVHASVDVEMLSTEESESENGRSFTFTNINGVNEASEQPFVPLRTFMDIDLADTNDRGIYKRTGSLGNNLLQESEPTTLTKSKARGSYRKYTVDQVEKLIDLVIEEGKTAKEAALITGINIRTAQHYVKQYNDDEERRLPFGHRKTSFRNTGKLTAAHSQFLIAYIDKCPTAILADISWKLYEKFQGLSISVSALHRHFVQKCNITLKKLEKLPAERNADRVIKLRKEKVEEWEAVQNLDFTKNCVFMMKQDLTCIPRESLAALCEDHQPTALCQQGEVLQSAY